jgi:RNA polymerase sigma-70 factor (ECF subfamily)
MAAVAGGDLEAFEELVRRHQRAAWSLAFRFVGNAGDAEDVVQQAFLRIFEAASRYRPDAAFRTYLYRVVVNLCKDFRSKKREVLMTELPDLSDGAANPEQRLEDRERAARVHRALDALPTGQHFAILLRHFEGLSYEEIAQVMKTSPKAVDSLLQRARSTLRAALQDLR